MNVAAPFIRRPVATTLLTLAIALAGSLGLMKLPVAPMPEVDLPSIFVLAQMIGASPETMATKVAAPLERHLGAIAGVHEMTSHNSAGGTEIMLEFNLDRNINGAARDVQAAINAARADLPPGLSTNPVYYKANLADWPITYLSLTSKTMGLARIHDIATTLLKPKLASIEGVALVYVLGSTSPAVRVELDPDILFKYGIGLESIRAALAAANANSPKGVVEEAGRRFQIYANDQAQSAAAYRDLVVAFRNGRAIRLRDLGEVTDSVEDFRPAANSDGEPSILIRIYRLPGANVIETVDRIRTRLAQLQATLSPAIDIAVVSDRTATARASLLDLEHALVVAGVLVILTILAFLQSLRAILIPAVVVPVSLLGTFGIMHLLGYSLDSLSLMALIIATGLVIDDSVVVVENITRHIEKGVPRIQAALQGAGEVSFTVLAMSLSLVAAFLPMLLMGGILGRIFHEFAATLSTAVLISLLVSLTTAPTLAALVLKSSSERHFPRVTSIFGQAYAFLLKAYDRTLVVALRHSAFTLTILFLLLCLNVYLYMVVPKGLLPHQDPGRLFGMLEADQSTSVTLMQQKFDEATKVFLADPSVKGLAAVIESDANRNTAEFYIQLKPKPGRKESADEVNARLSAAVSEIPGLALHLTAPQDIVFTTDSNTSGQYQLALSGDDIAELRTWTMLLAEALEQVPQIIRPSADQKEGGLETRLVIDRDKASRFGISASQIDNTLYDAFGQRQVSTVHAPSNQYRVVMEVAPRYRQDPDVLDKLYISTSAGPASGVQTSNAPAGTISGIGRLGTNPLAAASVATDAARNQNLNALANSARGTTSTGAAISTLAETMVPLSTFAHFEQGAAPLSVTHKGNAVAATISFNLAPQVPLSEAIAAIERTIADLRMPASLHAEFSGTAKAYQEAAIKQVLLILAALVTIYIVLGILYESFIHPITILSTLPSAGVGAILALMALRTEFTIIAFIGIILLIGIVMKNAIMMIDLALYAQRRQNLSAQDAIHEACLRRFRPIMMTTFAALFAALPLALGTSDGAELRQPLGIAIIGGLLVSQVLTLYTTPVVYLYLDRLQRRSSPRRLRN
ncbi:nodulation protein [Beijerinckiaceae bacterium]|nr:nodulation protein [Beijerinckiaceae bacterium]